MKLVSEKKDVQDLMKDHLCSIGWNHIDAFDMMTLRANSLKEPLLIPILKEKLKELNEGIITDKNVENVIRNLRLLPATLNGNEECLKYMRNQRTAYVEKEKRERNIKLVDYENPENNSFICTTEFVFDDKQKKRADLILFINGFPIAIIETKSPTVEEAEEEAYDQIRLYNELLPELFKYLQFYITGDGIRLYHGPTWKYEPKLFYRWKTQNHYNFEKLTKTLLGKQEVLRTLQDYVTFQRIDEELHKYILVPHQRRTIDKIIQKILENKEKGLIWHTQGAYKTLTMITTAKKLRETPELENPTLIVVVDRIELEAQIHQNFEAFGFPKEIIQKAESKEHLRELLASDYRGLIITIIHKFEGMPKHINKRDNIIVLIDEAHRSQEGDLGNYMRGALPNARYFGFTGTPVDKSKIGRGTFATFGYPEEPYLDKYSIDESIEDKTTVPIYYQLTPTKLHVDKDTLEKEFFKVVEEQGIASIEGVNRIIEKAKKTKAILKSPDRVDKIAQHIAEHYKKFVEPLGLKAFIVAVDREGCALYKEAIDKYLPKEYTKVVYTAHHKDGALLSKYHIDEDEEKKTRKAFKSPKEMPKILIVTEKLLTGYDAPILYAMYLDKPLKDHTLYQAIARVNRPYEAKTCGTIIDYIGLFDRLQRALAFDSKDISKGLIDIATLKQRFTTLITQAKATVENIQIKDRKDRVTKIIDYFYEEKTRDQYIKTFKETQSLYEILSPDEFLRDHIRDYKLLIQVYKIIYNAYNPEAEEKKIHRDILKKTEALIKSSVDLRSITDTLQPYKITKEITRLVKADTAPERVKVINLHRTLTGYVHQNKQKQPILISISESVEEIIKRLREKQTDIATALTELTKLAEAIAASKEEQEKSGLNKEEFTTYWILRNYKVGKPETMAKSIFPELEKHKEWLYNEKTERDLRRELYKLLLPAAPKETLVELTDNLLKMHKFLTEGTE